MPTVWWGVTCKYANKSSKVVSILEQASLTSDLGATAQWTRVRIQTQQETKHRPIKKGTLETLIAVKKAEGVIRLKFKCFIVVFLLIKQKKN